MRLSIVQQFGSFWELNDNAHKAPHFEGVFECGSLINERLSLDYDPKLILFAAYFHDLFAWNRVDHHERSYQWMKGSDHPLIVECLRGSEKLLVAQACHEHRASFKGEFSNEFCELINSADRELPGDVKRMVERAVMYRVKNCPEMSDDQRYEESVKHIKEKFGGAGYARYPEMYLKCFKEELQKQRDEISLL